MRIGIDIRYLSHNLVGGVHTYVKYLVPALLEHADKYEFFLYADTKSNLELLEIPAQAQLRLLPWRNGFSSIWLDFVKLKRAMAEDKVDIAHFPANYGFAPNHTKTVITLHDEINIMPWRKILRGHQKNLQTMMMMSYLHLCSSIALRKADRILTVSEYSKQQIERYAGEFNPEHIIAIHSAIEPGVEQITQTEVLAKVRDRYQIKRPFILADALKNPAVIVRAWQRLPENLKAQYQIVFFSRRPNPLSVVQEAVEQEYAQLLIRPTRKELIALFSQAKIFVFPSWIEGFGLPLLEAMACGAPVIASNRGSIPEIAGEAAIIIDAEDDASLAEHLTRLLTTPGEAAMLQKKGFERAALFSWQHTAQKVLTCYESLL